MPLGFSPAWTTPVSRAATKQSEARTRLDAEVWLSLVPQLIDQAQARHNVRPEGLGCGLWAQGLGRSPLQGSLRVYHELQENLAFKGGFSPGETGY